MPSTKPLKPIRFSEHFALSKSQAELDFIDIPLKGDICIFIDPYSFTLDNDPWFIECNDCVIDYFDTLISSISNANFSRTLRLLSNLHEPEDTHLGFSGADSSGRGIGRDQANDLLDALKSSKAVQSGALSDLSDCELLIPGISADEISDITTNIIRGHLLNYTEA